jgi:hypothetical protein
LRQTPSKENVELHELHHRDDVTATESSERNKLEVSLLKTLLQSIGCAEAESAFREITHRYEQREHVFLRQRERIERASALHRALRRAEMHSTELLRDHGDVAAAELRLATSAFDHIMHRFDLYKPDTAINRRGTAPLSTPSPTKRPLPRPPSTFPSDAQTGRQMYLAEKQRRLRHEELAANLAACLADEAAARGTAFREESSGFLEIETRRIDDTQRAKGLEMTRKRSESIDTRHRDTSTCMIQSFARSVIASLQRCQATEQQLTLLVRERNQLRALHLLQRTGRGAEDRREIFTQWQRLPRGYELSSALEVLMQAGSTLPALNALLAATRPDTAAYAPTASDGGEHVAPNSHPIDRLPFLHCLSMGTNARGFASVEALFRSAAINVPPIPSSTTNVLEVATAETNDAQGTLTQLERFELLDAIARFKQPPTHSGKCNAPLLCLFMSAQLSSERRLPYIERLLQINGHALPLPDPFTVALPGNNTMLGLQLLFDAVPDAREALSLEYLRHATWSAHENLLQGRIDEPHSPRWRPYVSLEELYEEERQADCRRELCDRHDLVRHEANVFAEIRELHEALMRP